MRDPLARQFYKNQEKPQMNVGSRNFNGWFENYIKKTKNINKIKQEQCKMSSNLREQSLRRYLTKLNLTTYS